MIPSRARLDPAGRADATRVRASGVSGTRRRTRIVAVALGVAIVAAACSSGGATGGAARAADRRQPSSTELAAAVAGYDLAVGPPSRFIVGVYNVDKGNVGFGSVTMRFSFLGEKKASGTPRPGPTAMATFLPLPGSEPPNPPAGPAFLEPSEGRGVYAATVGFDRAGIWQVEVAADIRGVGRRTATAAFEVRARHAVPAPGERALATDNLTVSSTGVPRAAIDSRANSGEPVPDPELHQTTIAAALAAHRPIVAVFSTPTFCVSRFCGPVTDLVAGLAREYADRAAFVHVEIWKDFEAKQLNDAAAEWLTRNGGDGNEPWVFLIRADGRIATRLDNVATRGEIEPFLKALPPLAPR